MDIQQQEQQQQILDKLDSLSKGVDLLDKELSTPLRRATFNLSESRSGPFKGLGEQLKAVAHAMTPGKSADPRLYQVRAATGLGEGVASDGGFLVQEDFSSNLINQIQTKAQVQPLCQQIQLSSGANGIKLNAFSETSRATGSRLGGITAHWLQEAGTKIASQPKFRQLELTLKKLIGLCYATDELLDDASLLERVITNGFASEFAFMCDEGVINGNGVGQPLGLLESGQTISVVRNTAGSITAADVVNMWARLVDHSSATWFVNADTLPSLMQLSIGVGTAGGQLVFMPPNGLADKPFATILGAPLKVIEQCATLGTRGDIILANLADGYVWINKGGIQAASSIHVAYLTDQTCYRFVLRCDGQPILNAPINPFKGSNTQSYAVTLAA